jgi:cytochrome c-type biogenesis protein CcmF
MLGSIVIKIAFAGGLFSVWAYYRATKDKQFLKFGRAGIYISGVGIILSSILLLTDILAHNFANAYVWSYSDRSLPLKFLLSTFYAGQEGSFLYWALCSVVLSFLLVRYARRRGFEAHVMTVFMMTQAFLLLLLLFKSPFKTIWDAFPGQLSNGQVPPDGRGLNPLLQNLWMVIHPPVLFIGFASLAVPFSLAVASLWRKEFIHWVTDVKPWVIFSGIILGTGIMLGAYWAYGVLGWGGYWGWDPVENSSLIPWLVSMALVHTIIVQKRTGHLVKTNFALAISSYVLVLYSTFLTRSGILGDSSVHSFTDPGTAVYGLLIAFLGVVAFLGFGMMYLRRQDLRAFVPRVKFSPRGIAITLGALALLACALVVWFGTSLPIFSQTTVDSSFYNTMNIPIVIAIALLIGYSLQVGWESFDGALLVRRTMKWGIISAGVTAVLLFFGVRDFTTLLFVFSAIFAFFVNAELAYFAVKVDPRVIGGKIAHIGLGLFLLGVIFSGQFGSKQQVVLPLNTPQKVFGYTLTYKGDRPVDGNKFAFDVEVKDGQQSFTLSPIMFENGEKEPLRNPDIKSFMSEDFYLSPVSVNQNADRAGQGGAFYSLRKGETASLGTVNAKFIRFDMGEHGMNSMMAGDASMKIGSVLELTSGKEKETITPVAVYSQTNGTTYQPADSKLLGAQVKLVSMDVNMGSKQSSVTVEVLSPHASELPVESLVIEASIKPGISLVWFGSVVLFLGMILSLSFRRMET